ncbi:MAG: hypothetical protein WC958_00790 [Dehalococcoidales bacterium]
MEPILIGQVERKVTTDVPASDELRALLRVVWTAKSGEVVFNPAEDLKRGDIIRVTVEKVSEAPKAD